MGQAELHGIVGALRRQWMEGGISERQEWLWGACVSELEYRWRVTRPGRDRCSCEFCIPPFLDEDPTDATVSSG